MLTAVRCVQKTVDCFWTCRELSACKHKTISTRVDTLAEEQLGEDQKDTYSFKGFENFQLLLQGYLRLTKVARTYNVTPTSRICSHSESGCQLPKKAKGKRKRTTLMRRASNLVQVPVLPPKGAKRGLFSAVALGQQIQ